MAILSRTKITAQARLDLEDWNAEQASSRSDSKLWTQKFLSDLNLVLAGFSVSGIGLNAATVSMSNAALIIPQNTFDFSYFISSPSEPDVVISDADLVDDARNYVELALTTEDNTPLTKAFWDPNGNSGNGLEFNQIVNTVTDLKANFVVSTGGFSGSPDRIPIAIIDTNPSGVIKVILDRRAMYGRLAKPNDLDNSYAWGTKVEPVYSLNMTAESGTFVAGETITIGGETAKVVTGGTTTITFNEPTGINFGLGDSVTGGTSGATGTVNTILESFTGVDKSLNNQKKINDALMTEFKNMKGTRFWWEAGATVGGIKSELMSTISAISTSAKFKWNGSKLSITDDSLSPSDSDNIAAIRMFNSTANLYLTRQATGQEIVTITLSEIPDTGILTLNQNGNAIPINWNDNTAAIQATWTGNADQPATISGSPAVKKIVITYNNPGNQVNVFTTTNTFQDSGSSVTETIVIQQGMASDGSITLTDGQVLYVDLPSPLANTSYNTVGSGAANYKVAARGSLSLVDATYWIAYREGTKIFLRDLGDLESGETKEINDETTEALKTFLGFDPETATSVPYTQTPYDRFPGEITSSSSLVGAISSNIENINFLSDAINNNVYDELLQVVSGAPANDNEITGPVAINTIITLPLDSRDGDSTEFYIVGAGLLQIYRNGNYLALGKDWLEVGISGSSSTQIQIKVALSVGERLEFRDDTNGGFFGGGGGGSGTLQDAYNNGNTIITSIANPFTVGGSAAKVAQFNGDIGVTGIIDPSALTLTPQGSNPLSGSDNGIWVDASGNLMHTRPSESDINITQTIVSGTGTSASVQVSLENGSGGTLAALTPVRIDVFGKMDVIDVSTEAEAEAAVGVTTAMTLNAAFGQVATAGVIRNVTTSAVFADILYVSKTGGLTTTKPSIGVAGFVSGDFVIRIGVIAKNPDNALQKDLILNVDCKMQL